MSKSGGGGGNGIAGETSGSSGSGSSLLLVMAARGINGLGVAFFLLLVSAMPLILMAGGDAVGGIEYKPVNKRVILNVELRGSSQKGKGFYLRGWRCITVLAHH